MLKSYLFCGYFLICNFSFPDRASINAYSNRIILNPLFRVEKNKSATNPITCGRRIRIFLESDDVAKSCLVCYWTVTQYGGTTCRPSFSRVNHACGLTNSILIRYLWTGKILNPERKRRGFKNIQILVDGAWVRETLVQRVHHQRSGYSKIWYSL